MPVPLRLDFGHGRTAHIRLPVKQAEETFELPLLLKPVDVEFNVAKSVLAEVKREKW